MLEMDNAIAVGCAGFLSIITHLSFIKDKAYI